MKEEMSWIAFVWCMGHRLELAIQDVLEDAFFDEVDDMISRIFYFYQSPKKLRELKGNKQIFLIPSLSTLACRYFKVNESCYIALFVVSRSTKNLSANSEVVVRRCPSK